MTPASHQDALSKSRYFRREVKRQREEDHRKRDERQRKILEFNAGKLAVAVADSRIATRVTDNPHANAPDIVRPDPEIWKAILNDRRPPIVPEFLRRRTIANRSPGEDLPRALMVNALLVGIAVHAANANRNAKTHTARTKRV